MSEMVSQAQFALAVQHIREDVRAVGAQINARLDQLNGQTRKHGEAIVVLQTQYAGLVARYDTHDEAIDDISERHARFAATVEQQRREFQAALQQAAKVGTAQAVSEAAPSKKAIVGIGSTLLALAAGLTELVRWLVNQGKQP